MFTASAAEFSSPAPVHSPASTLFLSYSYTLPFCLTIPLPQTMLTVEATSAYC